MIIKTGDEGEIKTIYDENLEEKFCSICGRKIKTIKLENGVVKTSCNCENED